jgi:GntR family transcriptional regulator
MNNKAIPLTTGIESLLRNKILSGQYEPGEKLPTEDVLLQHFGVSKITIRNALSRLEADGLIIRNRGKGTFVAEKIPVTKQFIVTGDVYDIVFDAARYDVKVLGIDTIKIGETRAAQNIKKFLNLSNEDEITWVRRIRLIKGVPILYLENFIPLSIGKYLTVQDLSERPLLKILKEKAGIKIRRGEMYIEAIRAEVDIARILKCQTFDPLIFMHFYYWFSSDDPFEIANLFMRAEYFKYKVSLDAKGFEKI